MARLFADYSIDVDLVDFNYFIRNKYDVAYNNDVFNPWEDNFILLTAANTAPVVLDQALAILGKGLMVNSLGDLVGGTVQSFGQIFWDASLNNWATFFEIYDLSLPASAVYGAAQTGTQTDDFALMRTAFSGADTMTLSNFDDHMRGFGGNDKIFGNGGSDIIRGDAGNDTLRGGAGHDILIGGTGRDTLAGGRGEDIFVFATRGKVDRVTDFDAKGAVHDQLDLSDLRSVKNWVDLKNNHMHSANGNVVIDGLNGDKIILEGVRLVDLDAGDFLF